MDDRKEPPATREKGLLEETRGLFDQMVGEAQRMDAEQRAKAPPRGPVGKVLGGAAVIAGVIAAGTLLYGFYSFPDAPIRQTPSGYAGKAGTPRTREDFEAFKVWEKGVIAAFVITFATAFASVAADRIHKRRA